MAEKHPFAFAFSVEGLDSDTFSVVSFKGYEHLSRPYRFEIVLASAESELDFAKILYKPCTLEIRGKGEPRIFSGLAYLFRHVRQAGKRYIYQLLLMPRLQQLSIGANARVFLDKSCISVIEEVFKQAHVPYQNRMQSNSAYPKREYICQFNESDFNFVSRWLEAQGIHYFFEQQQNSELLVLSDTSLAHVPCREKDAPMVYAPPSGLDHLQREDVVHSFISEHCCLPESVSFKDYNYELSKAEVTATQQVDSNGQHTEYHYGDNFLGQGYGTSPAQVLAQQYGSLEGVFHGKSYCPDLRTGTTFALKDHYYTKYNANYLLYSVEHEGTDLRFMKQELSGPDRSETQLYENTFRALRADVTYRPRRTTTVPRYTGLLTAVIDAEGQGQYAELDSKGRYKVRLPFDSEDKAQGKASHWIRLSEPYAGNAAQEQAFGMHFPLLKGTEVLLSYVEGDIDRPIIVGAVYNANNENPVNSGNKVQNVIKTKGGNRIVLDDTEGKESISMATAGGKSMLVINADGVNPGITEATTEKCVKASWNDSVEAKCGSSMDFTAGSSLGAFGGTKSEITVGFSSGVSVGASLEAALGGKVELGETSSWISSESSSSADENVSLQGGMNTVVKGYYKAIKASMIVASVSSLATGVGSWAAIAGANEDNLGINRKAAVIAGSIVGSIGLIGQIAGTAFAMGCYLKMKSKKSNSFYTTTMDLGKDGAALTVRSSLLHNVGCDIMVVDGQNANPLKSNASVLSIAPKGASITLANKAKAKITLDKGQKITLDLNNGSKKIEMSSSGISMASQGVAAVKITTSQLILQKDNAANIKLGSGGAFIKGDGTGQNYINVTSSGVRMQFANGQLTSKGMLRANANGMIMLG